MFVIRIQALLTYEVVDIVDAPPGTALTIYWRVDRTVFHQFATIRLGSYSTMTDTSCPQTDRPQHPSNTTDKRTVRPRQRQRGRNSTFSWTHDTMADISTTSPPPSNATPPAQRKPQPQRLYTNSTTQAKRKNY